MQTRQITVLFQSSRAPVFSVTAIQVLGNIFHIQSDD